jgi:L-proline amide hydrolase
VGHLPRRPGADRGAEPLRPGKCPLRSAAPLRNSEHLPDAPAEFRTPQLFKDELVALTRHLGIAARHAVVGQSWGGMLAMEYAVNHPEGLRGIVVGDSPASMVLWVSEANRLRADLPAGVQATLAGDALVDLADDRGVASS